MRMPSISTTVSGPRAAGLRRVCGTSALIAVGIVVGGCESSVDPPPPGALDVRITTSGVDQDVSGYQLSVTGLQQVDVSRDTLVRFDGLAAGTYSVQLDGVQSNCEHSGAATAAISAGETVEVSIAVSCVALPSVSDQVVWLRGQSVWIADPDLSDARVLYQNETGETTWGLSVSRDRKWFAFTSSTDDGIVVKVATFAGDPPWQIATSLTGISRDPSWTADGDLVFINGSGSPDLYRAALDGSPPVLVTSDVYYPDVSPDGTKVAFASLAAGSFDIYVMNVDGSDRIRLTTDDQLESEPRWSPDASRIALVYGTDRSVDDYDIHVIDADGSDRLVLTSGAEWDAAPSWVPDGDRLMFDRLRGARADLVLINVDGTGEVVLTDAGTNDREPIWVP